jgi:hypothetical protein
MHYLHLHHLVKNANPSQTFPFTQPILPASRASIVLIASPRHSLTTAISQALTIPFPTSPSSSQQCSKYWSGQSKFPNQNRRDQLIYSPNPYSLFPLSHHVNHCDSWGRHSWLTPMDFSELQKSFNILDTSYVSSNIKKCNMSPFSRALTIVMENGK